ncbi:hypothetical protein AK812_SmicGene24111 [Symbiodinium microadriaticum]|uniref:Reverse transcriptase domain-containing protein n=1 Tax=Symbiodinium microadriaticum TaxID=2951 RepID=A0A1Q9DFH9_SYMMI|nr:hypothetical protein AK812_SmicGene24111 [Symbiodinium microadriaticum]
MLKATWPHHFGNIATPQLWQEVHELFRANEEQSERELIFLNHDLVGFFNSISQADIIQSVRYLIAEFSKSNNDILLIDPYSKLNPVHSGTSTHSIKSNMTKINVQHIVDIIQFSFDACAFTAIGEVFRQTCGTSMGNQISPILSTCAIVATEITWLRLYGQHVASAHLADQLWIRRYVDNRAIIVDKDENCDDFLGFRINANNRQGKKTQDDVELTDVDSDIIQSVRYLIAEFSKSNNDILLIDPYSKLNPVHSGTSTHSIKSNMTKINVQHIVDIIQFSFDACAFTAIGEAFRQTCGTSMGNQISPILSTCAIVATEITWLRLYGQHVASAHLADQLWIRRYVDNRTIIVDKDALHNNPYIWQLASLQFYKKPVQLEDENCDDFLGFRINANNRQGKKTQDDVELTDVDSDSDIDLQPAPEIIAYTILEVTFDLRTLVHLAQTNKATWIRCSQVLRATSTECKIQANAPWHKRAGRAVDGNAMETPIDIKMYLFNKRMHTWYHHELSYQQYMDLQVRELLPAP